MRSAATRATRREVVAVSLIYAAVTAWWLWPLPLRLATHGIHFTARGFTKGADYYLIVWALSWGARALVRFPGDLFHANSFYPSTLSLAYSEHFLGHQPLFAPVYWLTGNPILATNLLLVSIQFLCATAMYALARRFVAGPAALVAGLLYAFCPWRSEGLSHFHLLGVQYLPLALLFIDRWLESGYRRDAAFIGAAVTLQMLSSAYLAYGTALLLATYVPLALWRWRHRLERRRLLGLVAAGAVPATALAATSLPYLRLQALGQIPSYATLDGPTPLGISIATLAMRRFLTDEGVGLVGYLLGLLALMPPWRERSWPCAVAVAAALTGVVVGSGPTLPFSRWHVPTPYRWLAAVVPGFGTLRAPARFAPVALVGFALLAGLGLNRLARRLPPRARWPLAAAAAAGALWTWAPFSQLPIVAQPVGATVPPVYRWLARHGEGRPLLELPGTDRAGEARRMYLSTVHWLPIVGGYSAYPPRTAEYIRALTRGLPGSDALQTLVDTVDLGWILVHTSELPEARRWPAALPDGLVLAAHWPDALLLRVTRAGNSVRQGRLLSARETLEGVPLEPLGDAAGWIEPLSDLPTHAEPGTSLGVVLAIHNVGRSPWPALGFVPRHLVRLRACIRTPDTSGCDTSPMPLPADVWPGRPVRVEVEVPVPRISRGADVLYVELVQVGDGPLSRRGVMPLTTPLTLEPRGAAGS